jgi:hypothetical protein
MASVSGLSVKRCGLDRLFSVVPCSLPPIPKRLFDLLVDGYDPLLRVTFDAPIIFWVGIAALSSWIVLQYFSLL